MASIKVLSAGACEGPLRKLIPQFERDSGHSVDLHISTVGALRDRIAGGEAADVVVLSVPAAEALVGAGHLSKDTVQILGTASCGVAVREGAPKPDIATVDSFKQALRAAHTVGLTDPAFGGSSGIYLAGLFDRLGVTNELAPKLVRGRNGHDVAHSVARGDAELGMSFTSEFVPVAGVSVVGPLPKEIGYENSYAAALPPGPSTEAARAFVSFVAGSVGKACFQASGLS